MGTSLPSPTSAAPSAFSSQRAGQSHAGGELFLQLERRSVGQRRREPQILDRRAMIVEALPEAGDERVERCLEPGLRRNRLGGHAIVPVDPDLDVVPVLRRAVVDGEPVPLERYRSDLDRAAPGRAPYERVEA